MPSEKQIAANRLNACLSTGPRTEAGKAQSSRNAMIHGLAAYGGGLFAHESPDEFFQMRDNLFAELLPQGAIERELANRIVGISWRLRRIPAIEAAVVAWVQARERHQAGFSMSNLRLPGDPANVFAKESKDAGLVLGRSFHAFLTEDVGAKLGRYEANLQRQLSALYAELGKRQARADEARSAER